MSYTNLLPKNHLDKLVDQWIEEDIPSFDYGGFVVGNVQSSAVILCKSKGIIDKSFFYGKN